MKIETAVFEASAGLAGQLPASTLPEVAFSGRSNVGKSSIINRLLNRKALARTSATPGKTATINFYKLDTLRLVDLPGYGYAKVSASEKKRWSELIDGYFQAERDLRLVVQLVDMRHPATAAMRSRTSSMMSSVFMSSPLRWDYVTKVVKKSLPLTPCGTGAASPAECLRAESRLSQASGPAAHSSERGL